MVDLSLSVIASLSSSERVGIVDLSDLMYFIVFHNCFLLVVFTFLLKNACLEFRNIVVTLFLIVLNLFQSRGHPDNLALFYTLFLFCIARCVFFESQGRFFLLGRIPWVYRIPLHS